MRRRAAATAALKFAGKEVEPEDKQSGETERKPKKGGVKNGK